jgi:hypothetical protein
MTQAAPRPRSFGVTLVGLMNLLIGGAHVVLGVYILLQGADFLKGALDAGAQVREAGSAVAPQGEEAARVAEQGLQGLGGIVAGLVGVIAVCTMLYGLPELLAGFGVVFRKRWGQVLAIILAVLALFISAGAFFALLQGQNTLLVGVVYGVYALVTFLFLIPGKYSAEFRRA